MNRPIKLFAYKVGENLHMDVDVIMKWPLDKLYEYMAYYYSQTEEFQEEMKDDAMTDEQRAKQIMKLLGG